MIIRSLNTQGPSEKNPATTACFSYHMALCMISRQSLCMMKVYSNYSNYLELRPTKDFFQARILYHIV